MLKRVSSDFGSATVMDSSISGPGLLRSGRSMLNPHAIDARASTSIAEIIFTFMRNLLLYLIRRRFGWVAELLTTRLDIFQYLRLIVSKNVGGLFFQNTPKITFNMSSNIWIGLYTKFGVNHLIMFSKYDVRNIGHYHSAKTHRAGFYCSEQYYCLFVVRPKFLASV